MRLSPAIAIALCIHLAPCAAWASEATEKIAVFMSAAERIRFATTSAANEHRQSNPQAAVAVVRSLDFIQAGEIEKRTALVLDKHMSNEDVQSMLNFMQTPLGRRVGATLRTAMTPQALIEAISRYPKQEANDPYFGSPAMQHMITAMDTPEWRQTWNEYGEVLMCRLMQKENPAGYERLLSMGKCAFAQAQGAAK